MVLTEDQRRFLVVVLGSEMKMLLRRLMLGDFGLWWTKKVLEELVAVVVDTWRTENDPLVIGSHSVRWSILAIDHPDQQHCWEC